MILYASLLQGQGASNINYFNFDAAGFHNQSPLLCFAVYVI